MVLSFIRNKLINALSLPEQVWLLEKGCDLSLDKVAKELSTDNRLFTVERIGKIFAELIKSTNEAMEYVKKQRDNDKNKKDSKKKDSDKVNSWDELLFMVGVENWNKVNLPTAILYCDYVAKQKLQNVVFDLDNIYTCLIDHAIITSGVKKAKADNYSQRRSMLSGEDTKNVRTVTLEQVAREIYKKKVEERLAKEKTEKEGVTNVE